MAPVVIDNPSSGLHVYVLAPLAVNVTLPPPQKAAGAAGVTVIIGNGFTVTVVAVEVREQLLTLVTVTV